MPRLHFKYIREHGVDEFIARCKEIVERHDEEHEEEIYKTERMRARHNESIEKFENSSLKSEFKKAKK